MKKITLVLFVWIFVAIACVYATPATEETLATILEELYYTQDAIYGVSTTIYQSLNDGEGNSYLAAILANLSILEDIHLEQVNTYNELVTANVNLVDISGQLAILLQDVNALNLTLTDMQEMLNRIDINIAEIYAVLSAGVLKVQIESPLPLPVIVNGGSLSISGEVATAVNSGTLDSIGQVDWISGGQMDVHVVSWDGLTETQLKGVLGESEAEDITTEFADMVETERIETDDPESPFIGSDASRTFMVDQSRGLVSMASNLNLAFTMPIEGVEASVPTTNENISIMVDRDNITVFGFQGRVADYVQKFQAYIDSAFPQFGSSQTMKLPFMGDFASDFGGPEANQSYEISWPDQIGWCRNILKLAIGLMALVCIFQSVGMVNGVTTE